MILLAALLVVTTSDTPQEAHAKAVTGEWSKCLIESLDRFSASSEPAETVATAALGSCQEVESRVEAAWLPLASFAGADALNLNQRAMYRMRETFRRQAIARVLETRTTPPK
ncbi:hypothetical protein [Sphingomonas sp.]